MSSEMLLLLLYVVCKNVAWNNRDSSWIWPMYKHSTLAYTYTHTQSSCSKHSQLRNVVRFCGQLYFAYQLPLSFKKRLFSLFEYANFASIVIQSHLVTTATNCSQTSASLCLGFYLPFKTEPSESYWILPTRFSVWLRRACCNICSSWGLYVFTGITQPAQTLPYEAHTQRATSD